MSIPEDLRYITPYIQRGQELSDRDPVVAYYAHYYAVKLAISRGPSNKDTSGYLGQLLDSLEQRKSALLGNEAITDDITGYAHVENFALKVFFNADNEDRAGKSSKKTAKNFLAASIFLELLKTFGELDPEASDQVVEEKIKYSKWKATDIMKALREGRTPTAGPPGGDDQAEISETQQQEHPSTSVTPEVVFQQTPSIAEFPSPPSNFTAPLPPASNLSQQEQPHIPSPHVSPVVQHQPSDVLPQPPTVSPPFHHSSAPAEAPGGTTQAPPTYHTPNNNGKENVIRSAPAPSYQQTQIPAATITPQPDPSKACIPDPATLASAQKKAKWAISALNYDDVPTARLQLLDALNDLGFNQSNNFGY
ncbi:hypothetical protein DFQ28_002078 [Apophysomyces sp. BC1034]|nr:hypothetical protein DFQ30_002487 [Apophysomyces sp. BC1015]KAG0179876.1 hypothetical protein DFQ29_001529 [Apophysomyces sp. BC1021]KAG0190409.1 hypothetical protein DFQ28_002078 [Apophysomyces sp. BC1034]